MHTARYRDVSHFQSCQVVGPAGAVAALWEAIRRAKVEDKTNYRGIEPKAHASAGKRPRSDQILFIQEIFSVDP